MVAAVYIDEHHKAEVADSSKHKVVKDGIVDQAD